MKSPRTHALQVDRLAPYIAERESRKAMAADFNNASHRVMELVQDGYSIDRACFQAASDSKYGFGHLARLVIEAKDHIPALIEGVEGQHETGGEVGP